MKRLILLVLTTLMLTMSVAAQTADDLERNLIPGESISDSLSSEDVHIYLADLDSAQFVRGWVEQETVDVVITLYSPSGERMYAFDTPARGKERFQFETDEPGQYRLEISPFEAEEGQYSIYLVSPEPLAEDPEGKVDQLMASNTGGDVPGAAVMVMKDGEIILHKTYGMASLTYDVPMGANTKHNIGSTSKQFTAFGVVLLQDQGQLSLDDDIREYIPELPAFDDTVTIRHLLTHTSGYREYLNTLSLTGRNLSTEIDSDKIIRVVQNQGELQNKPRDEFNYNNTGFSLMSEVVHRVTGTPFPEWMRDNVFLPLGMDDTVIKNRTGMVIENRSSGYAVSEGGLYEEVTDLSGAMGAGGIYTTMDDLAKWIRNLSSPTVGGEEIISEISTSYVLNNGEETGYGLGLGIGEHRGLKTLQHGGADMAHRSMLVYFPDIDAAVVTQSNDAGFRGDHAYTVADAFFEEYFNDSSESEDEEPEEGEFAYNHEQFDALSGRYELEIQPGFILTFDRDGERLFTQATGQPEIDIKATSDSTFTLIGVAANITFHMNEDMTADSLTLHQNGNHIARKIEWNPSAEELGQYTGTYYSEEISTVYTLIVDNESLTLEHYQMDPIQLNPGTEGEFSGGFPIGNISFIENNEGEITGFTVSNGRTRGVLFEKIEFRESD
jgi:CubicO group peptidase (beta-lactamase class C family)